MKISLSEAIEKRKELELETEAIEDWLAKHRFGTNELKWKSVIVAIEKVINDKWEEWQKYDDAIESYIKDVQVDLNLE